MDKNELDFSTDNITQEEYEMDYIKENDISNEKSIVSEVNTEDIRNNTKIERVRRENSRLPQRVDENKKGGIKSFLLLLLLIIVLVGLFMLGMKYIKEKNNKKDDNPTKIVKVKDIEFVVPSNVSVVVNNDDTITIDGNIYSPVMDENGKIIGYSDVKGNMFSVSNSNSNRVIIPGTNINPLNQIVKVNGIEILVSCNSTIKVNSDNTITIDGKIYTPIYDDHGKIIGYKDAQGNTFNVENSDSNRVTISSANSSNKVIKVDDIELVVPEKAVLNIGTNKEVTIDGKLYKPVLDNNKIIGFSDKDNNVFPVEKINSDKISITDSNNNNSYQTIKIKGVELVVPNSVVVVINKDNTITINGYVYYPIEDESGSIVGYKDINGNMFSVTNVNNNQIIITQKDISLVSKDSIGIQKPNDIDKPNDIGNNDIKEPNDIEEPDDIEKPSDIEKPIITKPSLK